MKLIGIATTALLLLVCAGVAARAATETWTGSGSDSNFSDGNNWSGSAAPGNTSGVASSNTSSNLTSDVAVFNAVTSNNQVTIDQSGQALQDLVFTGITGTPGTDSYTIGSNGGNTLYMEDGNSGPIIDVGGGLGTLNSVATGSFNSTSEVTVTIAAPIVIQFTSAVGSDTMSIYNDASNGTGANSGVVNVTGSITPEAFTGGSVNENLYLRGNNTNANTISGLIGNATSGTHTSTIVVTENEGASAGLWELTNNNNTFTGAVTDYTGTHRLQILCCGGIHMADLPAGYRLIDSRNESGMGQHASLRRPPTRVVRGGASHGTRRCRRPNQTLSLREPQGPGRAVELEQAARSQGRAVEHSRFRAYARHARRLPGGHSGGQGIGAGGCRREIKPG
jgi:hypothetical protein